MSSRKPSLVLVHGYRGAPIGLKTIAEQLEEAGYEVYVPAIPPFGGATLGHTYDAKSYADYLAKYIKSKSLDHPVLIGHSMGSIIVAATAHFHPDLINQKIIFLSPARLISDSAAWKWPIPRTMEIYIICIVNF